MNFGMISMTPRLKFSEIRSPIIGPYDEGQKRAASEFEQEPEYMLDRASIVSCEDVFEN
jgi:hypothetical protein